MGTSCLRTFIHSLGVLAVVALDASSAPQTWGVQFGTSSSDELQAIMPDGLGGTFSAGSTSGNLAAPPGGASDVVVVRSAPDGTPLWTRQIGTSSSDMVGDLVSDGAGGLFLAGTTAISIATMGWDGFLARMDNQGNLTWWVNVGTPHSDFLDAVVPDGSGGIFAVGKTTVFSGSSFSYVLWIVHLDGAGTVLWTKSHALALHAQPRSAVADGQGGLFVGGHLDTSEPPFPLSKAFVSRFSPAGDLIWTQELNSPQDDLIFSIVPDGSGGLYAAGSTAGALGTSQGGVDAFVARYDGAGNLAWLRQFGTPSDEQCFAATEDGSGGVVLAGYTGGNLAGTFGGIYDIWLMSFDGSGAETWSQQVGGPDMDIALAICNVAPQVVVAAGATTGELFGSHLGGDNDAWIARLDICLPQPTANYCVASPNSAGQGATIASLGSTDLSHNDFTLTVAGCPAGQIGLFILGTGQASIPLGDGVLCVGGGVLRLHPALITDGAGSASATLDVTDPSSSASQITPGSTWNFQFWYRDVPAGGAGFNLSNGLSATFCP